MARLTEGPAGRAWQLCPGISQRDLLRNVERIADLDAEAPDRTFDPMAGGP
jgi:hypothetical protein